MLLFVPAGITLKESVIHAIVASSSHYESSPGLAFLLKGKSIAAMSGEVDRAGRILLSQRIDSRYHWERKKKQYKRKRHR